MGEAARNLAAAVRPAAVVFQRRLALWSLVAIAVALLGSLPFLSLAVTLGATVGALLIAANALVLVQLGLLLVGGVGRGSAARAVLPVLLLLLKMGGLFAATYAAATFLPLSGTAFAAGMAVELVALVVAGKGAVPRAAARG